MSNVKVLFVCLGNICRSPLAEAIFKHKISQRGYQHQVEADSCGTSNYHIGDLPDERTRANAHQNGISINHRGRQLQPSDLEYFDFILAMDRSNHQNILNLPNASLHRHKVYLMRSFDSTDDHDEVPDPYYGGMRGFQEVFEILDRSTEAFLVHLEQSVFNRE
ncbi:MAG: low molecular weight phosphotyrosine protein phosphatase [Cyclobacteriaceae bacterium]|nr:low molecular weight phosphotyrosine protein phosphatase [Cyclobacteriaceae bacterium]UYN86251.1 MAG: low molecular weight phosphotyrosine protein phosphatase [Cyclobacteriaceae bacterium]